MELHSRRLCLPVPLRLPPPRKRGPLALVQRLGQQVLQALLARLEVQVSRYFPDINSQLDFDFLHRNQVAIKGDVPFEDPHHANAISRFLVMPALRPDRVERSLKR